MEKPSVAALQRLVSLVNYLSKFLNKLSELYEPLRWLTHRGVEWSWSTRESLWKCEASCYFSSNSALFQDRKIQWCGSTPKTGKLGWLLVKVSIQTFRAVRTTTMTHPQGCRVKLINKRKPLRLWSKLLLQLQFCAISIPGNLLKAREMLLPVV